MTRVAVRDLELRDLPRVLEIERESFVTPWTEPMFRSQMRFRDRSITIVLAEDEVVEGYAAAWLAADEIHLLSIAVSAPRRREGFGTALLEAVLARGEAVGGTRALLEVRDGNEAARSFYRAHGFRPIGRRRGYYTDTGEDAIVMERRSDA